MTKKCIKWYYKKTLLKKLKQMLSLFKFRRNSRQRCLEETVLLNNDDASSLQSEDLESISVDFANVHTQNTDSDNNSEKSISTYQESDSAIVMMESSLSSNISQTMPTPPVVVETISSPAVDELVFPAVVESTAPDAVVATEMTSLQEVEQEESAYEILARCVWIGLHAGQSNYKQLQSVIAHGKYASDADQLPSEVNKKIEEARKQKQCKAYRINKQYHRSATMTHNYVEETVNIVEDDTLELLFALAQS